MPGTLVDLSDNLKVEVVSDEGSIGSSNVALTGGLSRTAVASADGTVELTAGGAPMPGGVGDGLGPAIVGELAGAEGAAATARRGHGDESGPQPAAPSATAAAAAIVTIILTVSLAIVVTIILAIVAIAAPCAKSRKPGRAQSYLTERI